MTEHIKNIIDSLYTILPKVLGLFLISLFYYYIDGQITKNEITKEFIKNIEDNAEEVDTGKYEVKALYHCLNATQFKDFILNDSSYQKFIATEKTNRILQLPYQADLIKNGIITNSSKNDNSNNSINYTKLKSEKSLVINKHQFIYWAKKNYKSDLETYLGESEKLKQNIGFGDFEIPRETLPNVLLILLSYYLLVFLLNLYNLNIIITELGIYNKDLRDTITLYTKLNTPTLLYLIYILIINFAIVFIFNCYKFFTIKSNDFLPPFFYFLSSVIITGIGYSIFLLFKMIKSKLDEIENPNITIEKISKKIEDISKKFKKVMNIVQNLKTVDRLKNEIDTISKNAEPLSLQIEKFPNDVKILSENIKELLSKLEEDTKNANEIDKKVKALFSSIDKASEEVERLLVQVKRLSQKRDELMKNLEKDKNKSK